MIGTIAATQFLGMTLWFSATAVAPSLVAEFGLSGAGAAWLTMAVQAGFVAGTLASALLNLPDVIGAQRLFAAGCAAGAIANLSIGFAANGPQAIALRFATGAALACVYPPGLKIAASWVEDRRGTALGIVIGALTLGTAFPHFFSWIAADVSWRTLIACASILAAAGGALTWAMVREGPYVSARSRFEPGAALQVFRLGRPRLATLGYLGHMWELYAMWTWLAPFAAAGAAIRGGSQGASLGSLVAALGIGSGAVGCVLAGVWADRLGKAQVAGAAMVVSGLCAAASPLFFAAPPAALALLAIVWGASIVADSAQFSALVADHSPRDHMGTALTVQICCGFLLTMATIRLVGALPAVVGWQWAFVVLVPGPWLGAIAMRALARDLAERPGRR
jgi:MFS family permease